MNLRVDGACIGGRWLQLYLTFNRTNDADPAMVGSTNASTEINLLQHRYA
jgi:hypothetical protein